MLISIIIIVKNRQRHLANVLRGIQQLSLAAAVETVVIHMNEDARPAPAFFTRRFISKQLQTPDPMPLACARNLGAQLTGQLLIFLDVDCIPAADLVADYQRAWEQMPGAIAMGAVYYLSDLLPDSWQEQTLIDGSQSHHLRTYPAKDTLQKTPDYHLFWSLNFAVSRQVFWETLGGFDEQFRGYGAEDTDFAFTARTNPASGSGALQPFTNATANTRPPCRTSPISLTTPGSSIKSGDAGPWRSGYSSLPLPAISTGPHLTP